MYQKLEENIVYWNMETITKEILTYKDLKNDIIIEHDDYGIGALCEPALRAALKHNPIQDNDEEPFAYIIRVDGIVGGIGMWFPTRFKSNDEIIIGRSGSTLEVYEEYRKLALGVDITMKPLSFNDATVLIYAGISEMALPIYKKLRFSVFEYPRAMKLINSRCILESMGMKGVVLKVTSFCANAALKAYYGLSKLFYNYKDFKIIKTSVVPQWVDEIVLNDNHPYQEVHDQKWLQWNLDNNLHGLDRDCQSFYAIYNKEDPVAFFMTKERFREEAGGKLKNVLIGSIMEWGIADDCSLLEDDIYKMAQSTFSPDIDIIEFATDNLSVISSMKKYGFLPHGYAHIVFRDLSKKYPEAKDMNNWRIRFGYADVMLT